ncbi:hypothetical protein AGABI1DRAFT_133971 [Agaricus bisporus var. burnettii JB137-S8]|nr:uncharacterized protein AGABI1DRAFT_133971 [Agaricus bisporus var. burnettii JB137-S8]EKM73855.1 hypothetical protein AGABI1DRAFT_133971 [Agaricus bisporus var. burnettii JB137-S8]
MARITPRMATNPEVIAKELALFVSRIINSEWAKVNVGRMSITSAIREATVFHTPICQTYDEQLWTDYCKKLRPLKRPQGSSTIHD